MAPILIIAEALKSFDNTDKLEPLFALMVLNYVVNIDRSDYYNKHIHRSMQ
jgi:hypothetical protein